MAYVDLTTRFTYNLQTVFGDFSKLANNDKFMKDNGWEDGVVGVFFQAAAPTGWTKQTLQHGKALRVVSGNGGGVGGTADPSSLITLAHTHTISTQADHTHSMPSHVHHLTHTAAQRATGSFVTPVGDNGGDLWPMSGISGGRSKKNRLTLTGSYTTGAGGSHNHGGATNSQLSNISLAYANVIFASKDTSSGYTDLSLTFVHNTRHVFDYLSQLGANDAYNYARRTPAGTVSLFYSAAAPTGWTKISTNNAQLLRAVTDATGGASGGTADPASTITLAHTHGSVTSDGAHTHSSPNHSHTLADGSFTTAGDFPAQSPVIEGASTKLAYGSAATISSNNIIQSSTSGADGGGTTTSNGAHQHATGSALSDISLAYVNVIQASKDSAGAPTVYADMTAFFIDQHLLAYQDLQTMAYNDAYLYYHTMPSGAQMFFFQAAAPFNWTKVTTHDDKILRIVSGTSGGTAGGTNPLSAGLTLAHAHSLDTQSHNHTFNHSHTIDNRVASTFDVLATRGIFGADDSDIYAGQDGGAGDTNLLMDTDATNITYDTKSHNHGGLTGSSLSNVALAYASVVLCSKN